MAQPSPGDSRRSEADPAILLIPGLDGSGPDHWQTLWDRNDPDCQMVELGSWDRPHRNTWVNHLNLAIHRAANDGKRPVVLVAHSLGCLLAAWWARLESPAWADPVRGALLVAPPAVDFFPLDERVSVFAPTPSQPLPFPSLLVASRDDPWITYANATLLSRAWDSELVDAGAAGHLNADSGLGDWPEGRRLLARLLGGAEPATARAAARAATANGLVQGASSLAAGGS